MTISAHFVRALVEAVERSGVPRATYLAEAALSEERLRDDASQFAFVEFGRLQVVALELTNDPALGIHLAEHAHEAAFDLVGHLVSHATTLREAVRVASRFGALLVSDFVLELGERVDVASLRYDFPRTSERADRMLAEFVMAGFLRVIRQVVGNTAEPLEVRFEHARPSHDAEYTRFFGPRTRFRQAANAMDFPRAWLDQAQLHRNERLSALLREEARRALATMGHEESYSQRVTRHLRAHSSGRIPSMEESARHLGISVRSLRRRLAEEGFTYRQLAGTAMQHAASELLKDPYLSLTDAARAAGYSEPTAFHRAFKRWTGVTPGRFRRIAQ
jgi:AraC-like DNA-binding protein